MAAQSKLTPIYDTCIEYVHPWTDNCSIATAELLLYGFKESVRIYTAVYAVRNFFKTFALKIING